MQTEIKSVKIFKLRRSMNSSISEARIKYMTMKNHGFFSPIDDLDTNKNRSAMRN